MNEREPIAGQLRWSQRFALRVVPLLTAVIIRLLARTLRFESVVEDSGEADWFRMREDDHASALWCFWHRCLIVAACYFAGRPRTTLLISASRDGELIARTIERLGFDTVRGSSSRGGASGLLALSRAVEAGATGVIPGDGPRGPRYRLKPGIVRLSRLTGLAVHSFYMLPERAWVLRSWDGLMIPRPFSRVLIVWGRPAPAAAHEAGEEAARQQVEETLERLRGIAEQRAGH